MSDGNAENKARIENKDKLLDKADRFVTCSSSSETCLHAQMSRASFEQIDVAL
jgi:hypothetical protein